MDDIEKIIYENTKNIENKEDKKHSEKWIRAYYIISKETGIPLKDTVNHSYCVVKSERVCGKESLYGKVGVYERSERDINYFRFKGKRKLMGFSNEEDFFWARNVILLLEEREKIFQLF